MSDAAGVETTETIAADAEQQPAGAADGAEPVPAELQAGSADAEESGGAQAMLSGGEDGRLRPDAAGAATGRTPMSFLGSVEVPAAVELGRIVMSIGEVLALGPGSVVHLDRMLGDPVDLVIRDRLIARGEVVVVDDRFGLRITEIVCREGA
jgi:flagellar motor switch protein FliN